MTTGNDSPILTAVVTQTTNAASESINSKFQWNKSGASRFRVGSHAENQGLATAFALQPFHDRAVSAQEAMRHRTGRWRLSQASFEGVGRGACVARPTPR